MADGQDSPDEFELDRLRAEIQEEKRIQEMLELSNAEMKSTIGELEVDAYEKEGNEWKVRFETQQEMNQQQEQQILMMQDKVEELRHKLRQVSRTPRDSIPLDDMGNVNPQTIKALERENHLLTCQLRDLEWRLDQESKAYHRANDERKQCATEIKAAKSSLSQLKIRQSKQQLAFLQETGSSSGSGTYTHYHRDSEGNIPNDHRIIDPRRGPIKRTAGVKSLPTLEDSGEK